MMASEKGLGQPFGPIADENCCNAVPGNTRLGLNPVAVSVNSWHTCWQDAAAAEAKASCAAAAVEMADWTVTEDTEDAAVAEPVVVVADTAVDWIAVGYFLASTTYEVDFRLCAVNVPQETKKSLQAVDNVRA